MSPGGVVTVVYTDGACLGNPGPGGWAWAVPGGRYASGAAARTTNQRMEVQAALEAVTALDGPVEVVSDSTYVVNCFRDRWWVGWLARDWRNSQRKPVANRDLWEPLILAYRADPDRLRFRWVKGHSNDPMNDLVDRLAVEAATTQHGRQGDSTHRAGAARPPRPPPVSPTRVGVDTGGTFTDVVTDHGQVVKLDSVPADPARPVADGVHAVGGATVLAHGTTVATNALLERRGGRVALVSSAGQRDVIEIARQSRPSLYDLWADRPEPLVPRHLRFEVPGRLDAMGKEVTPLGSVPNLPADLDTVAVCLLHADRNPQQERAVAAALEGETVVCSTDVSPEYREYERTVTTVADAYLRQPCGSYLEALGSLAGEVLVMTSAGGLVPLADAAARPVALLLSGPAGGVLAASAAAAAAGFRECVTLDMGGTSTDVCLIRDGRPEPAAQRRVAGLPIRMPSLDVHTIGAGGGSIAAVDAGGALVVGPQSAGADPGPACYGRGGWRPTVTDADLVAGRIPLDGLAGLGRLDLAAACRALDSGRVTADGVISVVDHAMVQAIRVVSVQRGVDPAGLALVAFGGAGPLHACALAEILGMPAVLVPPRAGVLSALGMLAAPRQVDLVRSWPDPADHAGAEAAAGALGDSAGGSGGATVEVALDCRYAGQSHELTVPAVAAFAAEHARRNGFTMDDTPVEVVAVRASARWPSPFDPGSLTPPDRKGPIAGPAGIAEPDCTVWVGPGWRADAHPFGSWLMTRAR